MSQQTCADPGGPAISAITGLAEPGQAHHHDQAAPTALRYRRDLPAGPEPHAARPLPGGADFDLDVRLLEVADPAGLVNVTDDGCGSTCGACTTGAA